MKYEEAVAQIETIVSQMEQGNCNIDELASQLKKAQALIAQCKTKLTKVDEDIKKELKIKN